MHMLSSDTTVDMIYLDFSKAFDKVDHGVLLHKLKDLGITGKLGIWFFQFLTNRTHYVRIPCGISKDSVVLCGVPQGTVLGPLLFLIMISDINKGTTSSKLVSFADDTRYVKLFVQSSKLLRHYFCAQKSQLHKKLKHQECHISLFVNRSC